MRELQWLRCSLSEDGSRQNKPTKIKIQDNNHHTLLDLWFELYCYILLEERLFADVKIRVYMIL